MNAPLFVCLPIIDCMSPESRSKAQYPNLFFNSGNHKFQFRCQKDLGLYWFGRFINDSFQPIEIFWAVNQIYHPGLLLAQSQIMRLPGITGFQ